jgi:regulator of RNase E activity RraB
LKPGTVQHYFFFEGLSAAEKLAKTLRKAGHEVAEIREVESPPPNWIVVLTDKDPVGTPGLLDQRWEEFEPLAARLEGVYDGYDVTVATSKSDESKPITVGGLVEGSSLGSIRIDDVTQRALMIRDSHPEASSPLGVDEASVNVVFHIPGVFGKSDRDAIYVDRWFAKERVVRVFVPVGERLLESDREEISRFVAHAFPEAVERATDHLAKRRVRLSLDRARAIAQEVAAKLSGS